MHRLLGLGFRDKALGFIAQGLRLEARGEESEFRDRVLAYLATPLFMALSDAGNLHNPEAQNPEP